MQKNELSIQDVFDYNSQRSSQEGGENVQVHKVPFKDRNMMMRKLSSKAYEKTKLAYQDYATMGGKLQ